MTGNDNTTERRRRKQHVRNGWIVAGLLMLFLPLGGKLVLALFATFLTFAYLDEKPYGNGSEPN